eukprot:TRINITY_DN3180_c0_g1_i1.p1 TRINITY_DN3180_c0_g1~~TRINITY_DN3180_c0_g1_i1.p1  ORF type:complete len:925 (+),score=187.18 TRINITY_DN3180_c0_g1_i1:141-2915(+)
MSSASPVVVGAPTPGMSEGDSRATTARSQATAASESGETSSLQLKWCFGFNKELPGGIVNLSDSKNKRIFYVAGHTGVIYDVRKHSQLLLQGHCNAITAVCVSTDKRWIATADSGQDSMIIIWDANTGEPSKTIFAPHASGVQAMDMSPDSMFLVTLSQDMPQSISVWDWTETKDEQPSAFVTCEISAQDMQTHVQFNKSGYQEIITNGKTRTIFWRWELNSIKFYSPAVAIRDFKQKLSEFTVSTFVPGTGQALTGTVDGDVIVWDESALEEGSHDGDKRAVKVLHLHDSPITALTTVDKYIVTGSADGFVRFFDRKLRIVSWFEDIEAGGITSISFANSETATQKFAATEATFSTPDFIVGTTNALAIALKSYMAEETETEYRRGDVVLQGMEGAIHGLACHPARHEFAVTGYSGTLQVWDYEERKMVVVKVFDKLMGHTLAYDPKGNMLAVGCTNGTIKLLTADNLEEVKTFRFSHDCVTDIVFGPDARWFATSDADRCVGLYRIEKVTYSDEDGVKRTEDRWEFIGQYRAHAKPICSLLVHQTPDGTRLISVGEDRMLFEYDLAASSIVGGIKVKKSMSIDQTAVPTAAIFQPPQSSEAHNEDIIVLANDQYKFKMYNVTSNLFRKTVLAPTYSGPINKLLLVPKHDNQYIAYSTQEKVIGLIKTPLDGNPNKALGLIAHPGEVSNMDVAAGGDLLFTGGGADGCVSMWRLHPEALEQASLAGGEGVEPFIKLIEGEREGNFFREIEEYFYYAQLKSQGEASMVEYTIKRSVDIQQVPDILRALGYFPTEREVQEMLTEMRYSKFLETREYVSEIEFNELIKVYVNHRPVFGLGKDDVRQAFELLGAAKGTGLLDRDQLFGELQRRGEMFTEAELMATLKSVLGDDKPVLDNVPQRFTAEEFAEHILGFEGDDAEQADEE